MVGGGQHHLPIALQPPTGAVPVAGNKMKTKLALENKSGAAQLTTSSPLKDANIKPLEPETKAMLSKKHSG
ncbi:unnamed protein product, partial [Amoebophrya sp. A120]